MYCMLSSTVKYGNMSLSFGEKEDVINNRKKFFEKVKIPYENTLVLKALNKNKIFDLDKKFLYKNKDLSKIILEADGVVTKEKGIFFYLNFGDCIPLVIYDIRQDIMAFCHLGWKSVEMNLHIKAVEHLIKNYNSQIKDLVVELGPSIKKDSYIMTNPSQLSIKEWQAFLEKDKGNNYKVDLDGYVVHTLKERGIINIKESVIDTFTNKQYFSNYRENKLNLKERGRFISGAMIK